jgi:hypothetical protein
MDAFMLNTLCGLPVSMICDYAVTRMVPFKRPWTFVILYSLGGTGLRIALYYLGLAGGQRHRADGAYGGGDSRILVR